MDQHQNKIAELHEYYSSLEMPNCPKCANNTNVKKIIIGRPTAELFEYASSENSKIILGGCIMECGKSNIAQCVKCNEPIFD